MEDPSKAGSQPKGEKGRVAGAATAAKGKRSQVMYGVALIIALAAVGVWLGGRSPNLSLAWMFGIAFGFVLQRSRFCFTASLRDPVLTGSTSLTRGVIIAFAVATVGFAAIQYSAVLKGASKIPGHVSPVGIHTAIGATMFGIGMVVAGGCASGTLMRVGEGFIMQWVSLIGFVAGSLWGARDFGWWKAALIDKSPSIHLSSILGWPGAFFGQLAILGFLYYLAERYEKRRTNFLS